jgi:hypothetical protein
MQFAFDIEQREAFGFRLICNRFQLIRCKRGGPAKEGKEQDPQHLVFAP